MRLIDADALMQDVIAHSYPLTNAFAVGGVDDGMFINGIQQVVDKQLTIDAVPVVRCGECKSKKKQGNGIKYCGLHGSHYGMIISDDWFCADGERKDGDE